ncbi:MAG: adenylate/guanylate cyclase domain-containing protein [Dehalococcoidia bacterium]
MEQRIGFCKTSDGLTIAYATVGEGAPVVYPGGWPTELEKEWKSDAARSFLESLAEGCQLIRYDMRGSGLSDRRAEDFSLDGLVHDLEAVVDHLGLDDFDLMSMGMLAGPVSMRYAVEHPGKVKRLILASPFIKGAELTSPDRARAMIDYVGQFGMPFTQFSDDPDMDMQTLRDAATRQEMAATTAVQGALLQTMFETDVDDIVERIEIPTLVLHGRDDSIPFRQGREIASRLKDVKFVPIEGGGSAAWTQADRKVMEIREFLGLKPLTNTALAPDINTILFTDIENSTALTQRLGDEKARDVLREHERIVREQLSAHDGAEVKTMGDGFMASFGSASGALECAIAMQRAFADWNPSLRSQGSPSTGSGRADEIRIRIGLNAGEPIAEEDPDGRGDLFGTAVILAARIAAKANGGEILVSDVVRQLVAGRSFLFNDRGETELRGFEDPVRVYEVRWEG